MVVAAGALEAQTEEHITRGIGDVVENHGPLAGRVAVVVFVDATAQVAGGGEGLGIVGEQLVASQLLLHEPVVGLVGIQRTDHVIAVPPGGGPEIVGLVAVGVGVADQV